MTKEQGKPIRMARNEVGYAADFLQLVRRGGQAGLRRDHPVGRAPTSASSCCASRSAWSRAITPWNYPVSMITRKVRTGARRRVHDRAQAGGADAAAARSRSFKMLRGDRPARGRREPRHHRDPSTVGDASWSPTRSCARSRSPGRPRSASSSRQQAARRRQAGVAGARRARAVHRVRRRRPRARGQGRGGGEVPQHRPGVHLPEPHVRPARHRRAVPRHAWTSASATLKAGSGLDRRRHRRTADRRRRADEDGAAGGRRRSTRARVCHRRRAAHRRRARRRLLLRAHAARRRHARHAHLPRGDLRPDRAGHRVRRRRRGHRDGQRHRLRAGVVRVHPSRSPARSGSSRR